MKQKRIDVQKRCQKLILPADTDIAGHFITISCKASIKRKYSIAEYAINKY